MVIQSGVPPLATGKQNGLSCQALFPHWIGQYSTRSLTSNTRSPLSSLVLCGEPSLTGVCWLSLRALDQPPYIPEPAETCVALVEALAEVLAEALAEVGAEPVAEPSVYILT